MIDTFIALDLEATGMDPSRDEVIEIGAVKFRNGTVVGRFESLVRPSSPISLGIQSLTGLTNDELRGAPLFASAAPKLRDFIRQSPIVGQSVDMDLDMLAAGGLTFSNTRFDTFELATILLPELPAYSLATIASVLAVDVPSKHRAIADAETTMVVFNRLVERAEMFDDETLERLVDVTRRAESHLTRFFSMLLRRRREDLHDAGTTIGAQLLARMSDSAQTGSEAMFLIPRERPERLEPTGSDDSIAIHALDAVMASDGPFAKTIPGFEERPQQQEMLRAVADTLNQGGHLLVEAGTGTGKSLGYLIPAALHAVARGDRVVVSTATIALQDQLLKKDVPALRSAAECDGGEMAGILAPLKDLKVVALKGRANYLCLRRWFIAQRDDVTSPAQAQLHAKIISWLQQTDTGDSAELHLSPEQRGHWNKLAEEEGACIPAQCVFHRRNQCFLFRARQEAESAHIVIVNHSLLLSDMLASHTVIPTFSNLVVDEAHHLESEATDQVGYSVSRMSIVDLLRRVVHDGDSLGVSGALGMTFRAISQTTGPQSRTIAAGLQSRLVEAVNDVREAERGIDRIFARLSEFAERYERSASQYDRQVRLTGSIRRDPGWSEIEIEWDDSMQPLARLLDGMRMFDQSLDSFSDEDIPTRPELRTEFEVLSNDLSLLRSRITELISAPDRDTIYWVSTRQGTGETSAHAAPLHVGEILEQNLFSRCESLVLTSATLTTDGSFDYIRDRLGLDHADELRVPSPFDYAQSALLAVVDDIPEPGEQGYQKGLQEAIVEICARSGGRAMVLFTSHSALQTTYRSIRRPLEAKNILVLGQRIDGSPRQLIERLKANPRTIILGTNSFWEGVDVVGDALSLLIITKLPFPVPSDPVFSARSEQFDDPFGHYAVPQAILRFKQGFGRLIRSSDDRGVCVVLDRRIISRRYGESFINSLPGCSVRAGSVLEVSNTVEDFLRDRLNSTIA